MRRKLHHELVNHRDHGRVYPLRAPIVWSVFLTKLGKHLGLIACLLIAGQASGRPVAGQIAIFFLVVLAAALHATGRALQSRLSRTKLIRQKYL